MKKSTVVLLLWLLLSFTVQGQAFATRSQDANSKAQEKPSAELIEASKLSVQVVQYYKEGKFDEALPLAKRAVELREKALGHEHVLVGDALANLASIYIGKQKLGDAGSAFERVLNIYAKVYGAENPKLCGILDNLAWIKFAGRDYGKAEDFMQRSIAIKEKAFGENSKEAAQAIAGLGLMKQRLRRYQEAVPFYKRAFAAMEKNPKADNKELADLAQKCSCILKLNKQHEESEEYAKRAQDIRNPQGSGANVVRRTGGVLAGAAIHREEPAYPVEAKRAGVEGSVIVEVTVDETGKVIQSRVLCGDELLSYSAEQAARKWRFTPTSLSGVAVKVVGTITFNFNL
jgi:TonB family protein